MTCKIRQNFRLICLLAKDFHLIGSIWGEIAEIPAFWAGILCLFGISFNSYLCLGIRNHRHNTLVTSAFVEIHHAVNKCIQCVILTDTYVLSRIVLRAALANDDVAGCHALTTPDFHTESL